ncbi:glycosyltransferase family protein [Paramaledivibacter caminithermalis]|jgi:hypothetical protein|uniref:Glycosyltransferase subfamily 4-like N-terminal domain-containing protein n=1 Tax=Paramaledivibacter caminithermalis (strain DSM 15212 / CIP 107654 / DViRD3) TaxID=1121301 RepID=A0A1M6MTI2_PARC5|nr:glycosyltransferase [Paramaledivibacter caminithermalis]SHJ86828.1 hypothetical protein SAMN02745912_01422 [Paramaledivibacter caminithermalis DSM 15212]
MKKILFINTGGIYPYHISGAEETIDQFLKYLTFSQYECLSINCKENYWFSKRLCNRIVDTVEYVKDIYLKIFFNSKKFYNRYALDCIKKIQPDVIFTQLSGSLDVIKKSIAVGIPVILFMHSYDEKLLLKEIKIIMKDYIRDIKGIICISRFIYDSLPKTDQKNLTFVIH